MDTRAPDTSRRPCLRTPQKGRLASIELEQRRSISSACPSCGAGVVFQIIRCAHDPRAGCARAARRRHRGKGQRRPRPPAFGSNVSRLHGAPMTEPILLTIFANQLAAAGMLPTLAWHKIWIDALRLASPAFSHRPPGSSPGGWHRSQCRDRWSALEAQTDDPAAGVSVKRRLGAALKPAQRDSACAGRRKGAAA